MKALPFIGTAIYLITGVLFAGGIGGCFPHPFNLIVSMTLGFMVGWFSRAVYRYLNELINT